MSEDEFLKDLTEIHDEWFSDIEPKLAYNRFVLAKLKEKGYKINKEISNET